MAWVILKSAGDDVSFCASFVDGKIGHPYAYAKELAWNITQAMKLYVGVSDDTDCAPVNPYLLSGDELEVAEALLHKR